MTEQEAHFVEAMGQFLGSSGMPRMAGRMWGWLLICDPPEQSAAQLADELQASRGAISGTARLLQTAGFIRRSTRRGDRREYFSAPPETFHALLVGAGQIYHQFHEITGQGVELLADRPAESRQRIEDVHDFAGFIEREIPLLIEHFETARRAEKLEKSA